MAKIADSKPLLPSVLDRLIDHEPGNERETPKSRTQVLRELKQSVQRDLRNLLNTRSRYRELPDGLEELETSLVTYGIPDFSGVQTSMITFREEIRRWVENAIRRFEPRIKSARVRIADNHDPLSPTLRFRIDAVLHAEPAPEPVVFDSSLETSTGQVNIEPART